MKHLLNQLKPGAKTTPRADAEAPAAEPKEPPFDFSGHEPEAGVRMTLAN